MLDAAREAMAFAAGRVRAELDGDRQLTMALVKEIEIIGEAAYQMAESSRNEVPGIPWPDVIGMRHRLVHAYFEIRLDILWDTVTRNLPPLIASLQGFLGDEG
jgi:uncharacterized protein with HEPN domain